ncbi:GNAT family N-acetyltransferase [Chloroflexota bacterium]
MPLVIRPFEPHDQDAARRLILTGLGEHFGYIDETCNPDIDDIRANYLETSHAFIVAEIEAELVGTGALLTKQENMGRIVRMSVSRSYRRQGIGGALVSHLLDLARQRGWTQILVSTEPDWEDAIGFYNESGFTETKRDDVGVYFVMLLN